MSDCSLSNRASQRRSRPFPGLLDRTVRNQRQTVSSDVSTYAYTLHFSVFPAVQLTGSRTERFIQFSRWFSHKYLDRKNLSAVF